MKFDAVQRRCSPSRCWWSSLQARFGCPEARGHAKDLLDGQHVDPGAPGGGLAEIQSQAQARQSESDRQQQLGERQFRRRIAQLADAARTIGAGWKRFRDQCYQSPIAGSFEREWFALVAGALPANAGAGCGNLHGALQGDARQFRELMRAALAEARRADVLPGTVRDLLRANRLDFEWER